MWNFACIKYHLTLSSFIPSCTQVMGDADKGLFAFVNGDSLSDLSGVTVSPAQIDSCRAKVATLQALDRKNAKGRLDSAMQGVINKAASDVIKACIPGGLEKTFIKNHFSMMVLTGAKGSAVNQSQISCFLGQQALEGQRVPVMISGKSLPSFRAYDASARAGGFIQDRFLTGVKPQEYYFHCMAGREGLVDTAVKTSRSGYLQRCLVKHLEELKVHYDMTVRDSGGNVVQFLYGEDGLDPVNTALLGGKANQMLFMARNNQALVYKYSLTEDYFNETGLDMTSAVDHHARVRKARSLISDSKAAATAAGQEFVESTGISKLKKGSVVLARRKQRGEFPWTRRNMMRQWFVAEIVKVRANEDGKVSYDMRYEDGVVEKKVPVALSAKVTIQPSEGSGSSAPTTSVITIPLLKLGLPDPAMSVLRLNKHVGACSEKIQDALTDYIKKNPDGAISKNVTDTSVTAASLELLMWVKYMRSLACPGEAVGCVAAQSIGEPSTQMTLNTFHLAGHGGANVTLGIPRLREVLMTASKTPKTPTMLIPLVRGRDMNAAKVLARRMSRLALSTLLNHLGGIEVAEGFRKSVSGRYERTYRIRLIFESPAKIFKTFDVPFSEIVECVKTRFIAKLAHQIKIEQRRAGEKSSGKHDPLSQFRSKGSDAPRKGAGGGDDDGEDGERDGGNDGAPSRRKRGKDDDGLRDEEDEEEEDEEEDDGENGTLNLGRHKEVAGYDDDDDDEVVMDEDGAVASNSTAESDEEDDGESNGDDSDDEDRLVGGSSPAISGGISSAKKAGNPSKNGAISTPGSGKSAAGSGSSSGKGTFSDNSIKANEREGWAEIQLSFPAHARRLLMVQLAEQAAQQTSLRVTKNIANAYGVQCEVRGTDGVGIQTEGVNFEAIWDLQPSLVMINDIKCNDIYSVLQIYGVEAARQTIVAEVMGVFGVYGIDVNPRHLSLIGDFMTRNGSYTAMNRIGMMECPSPFLQMSFETTCTFLTRAAQEGHADTMQSPSSRIVLGSVSKVGTGGFDVLVPFGQPGVEES